ncbi:hypothetical protein CFD26_102172 [Aspergillus turcosus]|uniref:Stress-response A/B barrel domain-containing protein n=1 Tax=Aspergillus turcosus TaxID=1245748 RepID=A0A3R7J7P1_9EURO|nr:hypothetical protein CFD26_102172 [Aspergillus turcosus]
MDIGSPRALPFLRLSLRNQQFRPNRPNGGSYRYSPTMTIVHMVLFKFRPDVTQEHKDTFVRELKKLKDLDCVKGQRLVVGGPSITDPIERSKGFEIALLSFHENREALEAYQASKEHHRVTSTYMFPYKEDLIRFDFEVAPEDEYMWDFLPIQGLTRGLAKE